jgi:hypothetical protein
VVNHPNRKTKAEPTAAMRITRPMAKRVLEVVDAGLVSGLGRAKPGQTCVEGAITVALGLPFNAEPICAHKVMCSLKVTLNDAGWSSPAARAKGLRKLALLQLGTATTLDGQEFARRVSLMVVNTIIPETLMIVADMAGMPAKHKTALVTAAKACESAVDLAAASDAASDAASAASAAIYAASDAASAASDAARAASAASYAASDAASAVSYAVSYAASDAARAASYAASAVSYAASYAARDSVLSRFADRVCDILIAMKAAGVKWLDLIDA